MSKKTILDTLGPKHKMILDLKNARMTHPVYKLREIEGV